MGPNLVQDPLNKVKTIREKLLVAQSRQMAYADNWRRDLEFVVGVMLFLRVSPTKGVIRFRKKGKLSPRYVGPYKIIKIVGNVVYQLALPLDLDGVHPLFLCVHVEEAFSRSIPCDSTIRGAFL